VSEFDPTIEVPSTPTEMRAPHAVPVGGRAERARPERVVPVLGAIVVVTAVLSLLDDLGIATVPWWAGLLVGVAVASIALTVRGVRSLQPGR
jgi:hypothetical protein